MYKALGVNASITEIRDVAIIGLAFSLLLRHDEISHISCRHLRKVGENLKLTIVQSKTDRLREGRTAWLAKGRTLRVMEQYMDKAGLKYGQNHFLFGPSAGESILNQKLSYASYRHILKSMLERQKIDSSHFGFHSCRSGGATALAGSTTQRELMATGRWKDQRSLAHYVEVPLQRRLQIVSQLDNV